MDYYKTSTGHPVHTNAPQLTWIKITKEEYDYIANVKKIEADQKMAVIEAEIKVKQDREKLIQQRMREIAEKQLIDEGIIEKEK